MQMTADSVMLVPYSGSLFNELYVGVTDMSLVGERRFYNLNREKEVGKTEIRD